MGVGQARGLGDLFGRGVRAAVRDVLAGRQPRFSFNAGSVDRVGDVACRQISLAETTKPTLVRTLEEKDVPLTGNACIDADGVVWRTRIEIDGRFTARGAVEVVYGPDERVDVLVPKTMW